MENEPIWALYQGFEFYFEARIRILNRIKVKGMIRIRIRIKVTSRIRIRIKVTSRIRIRINMMRIRDTARESYGSGSRICADPGTYVIRKGGSGKDLDLEPDPKCRSGLNEYFEHTCFVRRFQVMMKAKKQQMTLTTVFRGCGLCFFFYMKGWGYEYKRIVNWDAVKLSLRKWSSSPLHPAEPGQTPLRLFLNIEKIM